MKAAIVLLLLAVPARGTEQGRQSSAADAATIAAVEKFLKIPLERVPPESVGPILAIPAASLPKKLQARFKARRVELYTLRELAETSKKGSILYPKEQCERVKDSKSGEIGVLKMAGYVEVSAEDLACITTKTKCTELELMCEFSLQILSDTVKGKKRWHYLFHQKDPVLSALALCRPGSTVGGQSNFFGISTPLCGGRSGY